MSTDGLNALRSPFLGIYSTMRRLSTMTRAMVKTGPRAPGSHSVPLFVKRRSPMTFDVPEGQDVNVCFMNLLLL